MLYLLLMLSFIGCASVPVSDMPNKGYDRNLHQLYIDEKGNLLNSVNGEVIPDESAYIDKIFNNFEKEKSRNPNLQLIVFIHGGLNTYKDATSKVDKVMNSGISDQGKYPLFISWNSGAFTNYKDHLLILRRGIRKPILGALSSPFVLLEDVFRSVTRVPASTYYVILGQNTVFKGINSKEETAEKKALPQLKEQGFKIHKSPKDTGYRDWWTVWNPVKLVTAPFIDALGTGAWNSMLRRTDLVLRKDIAFKGAEEVRSDTAVTKFFKKYSQEYSDHKVTIIGHSMGTIIANNIIAKYQHIKFSNIVYMAAACKIKDLEYVIAPFLERNPYAEFYNLSLSPYLDIRFC